MHKVKNKLKVNCVNITPKCDGLTALNKVSQDSQDLSKDDDELKKCINYENMAICIKELEKALFSSIQSNLEIIEYYNSLRSQIE